MTLRSPVVGAVVFFLFAGALRADATHHTVQRGQTLFSIARAYGVSVQHLAAANNIMDPSHVEAGRRLVIPPKPGSDRRAGRAAAPAPRLPAAGRAPAVPARLSPEVTELLSALQWPVDGPVISSFAAPRRGHRRHKGIDIKSPEGAPVKAVADGVVTLAKDRQGAYGRLVVVDHGFGITSRYGHNSRNLVEEGQRVSAGEVIALVGRTGNASCDHLHFELRVEEGALDPAKLLPDPAMARAVVAASEPESDAIAPAVSRPVARGLYPREPGKGPPPE